MSTPTAVVFDIGNVLITWNPERLFDQILPDVAAREALFETVDLHGMNDRIDRGAPFRETIYAEADKHPEYRDLIRLWHDRWIEMAAPAIDHSVALLRALRGRDVPVFALSNFGVESFDYAVTHYPFLEEFDRRYISGHMKTIKPEAQIYEMVEADCGHAPGGLLFIDDRADNIAAAAARGWQTHQFDGAGPLARRLVSEGLLSADEAGV